MLWLLGDINQNDGGSSSRPPGLLRDQGKETPCHTRSAMSVFCYPTSVSVCCLPTFKFNPFKPALLGGRVLVCYLALTAQRRRGYFLLKRHITEEEEEEEEEEKTKNQHSGLPQTSWGFLQLFPSRVLTLGCSWESLGSFYISRCPGPDPDHFHLSLGGFRLLKNNPPAIPMCSQV